MTIRFFVIYNAGRESMPYNTVPVIGYASHFHYSFQNSILHTTHVWKIPLQIQIQIAELPEHDAKLEHVLSGQLLKVIYSCCSIANSVLKNTLKGQLKPFSLISARLK
jgi:hypothetical protein